MILTLEISDNCPPTYSRSPFISLALNRLLSDGRFATGAFSSGEIFCCEVVGSYGEVVEVRIEATYEETPVEDKATFDPLTPEQKIKWGSASITPIGIDDAPTWQQQLADSNKV